MLEQKYNEIDESPSEAVKGNIVNKNGLRSSSIRGN